MCSGSSLVLFGTSLMTCNVESCLSLTIAVMKVHDLKPLEEERGLFCLYFHSSSLTEARAWTPKGQEPGARTDAEAMKECCLLAFSAKLQLLSTMPSKPVPFGRLLHITILWVSMKYSPGNLWNWFYVFPEETLPKRWCLGFFLAITNFWSSTNQRQLSQ